jgi:Ca2+-binding EF-hand superfamily protein
MSCRIARSLLVRASSLALAAGFAMPALADDDPAFSDLPPFLLQRMNRSATLDDYVSDLVREAKRGDLDNNGLDRQDIDAARQMEAAQYRASMVTQAAMYDLDATGSVTRDEATRAATFQMRMQGYDDGNNQAAQQKRISQQVDRIMALDGNNDGTVTLQEAMQAERPDKGYRRDRYGQYETLLALDPNGDGRLTMEELDKMARAAFQEADYDQDGTLSPSELKLLEPAREFQRQLQAAMPCDLPKPGDNDLLAVLGIYDGVYQSNVTVAGQDEDTQLTVVDIEPGDRPLYLVLSSYGSMIWQFRGATDRVAKATIVRSYISGQRTELAGSGAVGLPAEKIAFLPWRSCGSSFNKTNSKEAQIMARMVKRVTGRAADAMVGVYSSKLVALPSGTIQAKGGDKNLIVPGDGNDMVVLGNGSGSGVKIVRGAFGGAQQEDWLANPDDLVTVDPAQVVAPGKVELYEVLPNQYGLRQLVNEGKLERTEQGYRIVQPIARFPSGLAGAHRVVFLLPEGMPMPAGNAGHSQIILEKKPAQ